MGMRTAGVLGPVLGSKDCARVTAMGGEMKASQFWDRAVTLRVAQ